MSLLQMILIIIHVIISIFLIIVILLQPAKYGSCSSTTADNRSVHSAFGIKGPVPLLVKLTYFFIAIIMIISIMLGRYIVVYNRSVMWEKISQVAK